jgi:hypothetical protein
MPAIPAELKQGRAEAAPAGPPVELRPTIGGPKVQAKMSNLSGVEMPFREAIRCDFFPLSQ